VVATVLCAGLLVPGVAVATPAGAGTVAEHHVGNRGELVSAELVMRLSREQVADYLAGYELGPAAAKNGVDLYLVGYRTVGTDGRPTTASSLTVVPRTGARTVRTVAWLHGTRAARTETGSVAENLDRGAAVLFAASGYVTVAPDYLGLGTGPGHHPYMLTKPTVTATVDALRAGRTLAARHGKRLDGRVLLSGFSQGGQASMVVGRALRGSSEFEVRGISAIAGPHDIRGEELPAALDGRLDGVSAVIYLGYAMTAWNRFYPLYDSPSDVFRAPYDATVEGLFDGSHSEPEIAAALPGTPRELFTDVFLANLAHPTGTLKRILEDNDDPCQWRPTAPVTLFAGTADTDVVLSNSESCRTDLQAHGARAVRLVNLGAVDHFGTARTALPQTLKWFATLR
jgi:acetyl esterase/lipase